MDKKAASFLSFLGTFSLFAYIGFTYAPVGEVWNEIIAFLTGDALEIERVSESLLVILPVAFLIIVFDLIISLPIGFLVNRKYRKSAKFITLKELFDMPDEDEPPGRFENFFRKALSKLPLKSLKEINETPGQKNLFGMLFQAVLLEELFARALFLGLLTKWFTSTTSFYVLLIVGNGLWALMHVTNYEKGKRHPIRTLTQFCGGFLHAYVFVKYGFMFCFFTHFAFNASIFAFGKRRDVNWDNIVSMTMSVWATVGVYFLMRHPLTDASAWVDPVITFNLEGWGVWDFALLSVFVSYFPKAIMDIFLYDRRKNDVETVEEYQAKHTPVIILFWALAILLLPVFLGLCYWVGGWFFAETPSRVLFACMPLALLNKTASLSAAMRVFWVTLPNLYVLVCITQATGYWATTLVLAIETAFILAIFFVGKLFKHA